MSRSFRFAGMVIAIVSSVAASSRASVVVNFSGGGGSPLTISLPQPIQFTATSGFNGPIVQVVGTSTGGSTGGFNSSVTGNITYSVNGGAAHSFADVNRQQGSQNGNVFLEDFSASYASGDVVRLTAGSLTTTSAVAAAAPASGNYSLYLAFPNSSFTSNEAVPAPEPASLGLIGVAAAGLLARRRRRCR